MELGKSLTDKDRQWVLFEIHSENRKSRFLWGELEPFNNIYRDLNRRLAEIHDQVVISLRDEFGG